MNVKIEYIKKYSEKVKNFINIIESEKYRVMKKASLRV